MVIKLYISGISGNKEVKKKQQRVQMILDSKQINYEAIDITEPGKEKDKEFMQQNGKVRESLGKYPLPPQIFNDDDFCGDYEDFDLANEVDELEKFLHIETSSKDSENDSKHENELNDETRCVNRLPPDTPYNPYEYHTFKVKYESVNGLKEQIISISQLAEENNETEEVKKQEVNGECEAVPDLAPSSESVTENIKTSAEEVVAPEKEESSPQENRTEVAESGEKEGEGNEEEKEEEQEQVEEEAAEEEEKEDVEASKEDKVEEEKSPLPEEKENEEEKEEEKKNEDEEEDEEKKEEEVESEKEEKESDNESAQSEKSQED